MCFFSTSAVAAQDAVVTFYSHGSFMTSGAPGSKHGIYYGAIYDGDKMLVSFREGFVVKNNRFATFKLSAGVHSFSASYTKHPSKDHTLQIELTAGQPYFIRAQSESSGILIVEVEHGRLDQIACDVAQKETENAKPLITKAISPTMIGNLIEPQLIPSCH
jgi:hypothetical protein